MNVKRRLWISLIVLAAISALGAAAAPGLCPNPNCRKPVEPDWKFCKYCGTSLDASTKPPFRGRLLVVSQSRGPEDFLRKHGATCTRRSILPEDFRDYDAVWLIDWSSIEPGAGTQLERYVEDGGGVVAVYDVPAVLAGGRVGWMGITRLTEVYLSGTFIIQLPNTLLGADFSRSPDVPIRNGGTLPVIESHQRGGEVLASGVREHGRPYGVVYTYTRGRGRFYYQSCVAGSPNLEKALLAGLKWVIERPSVRPAGDPPGEPRSE